ncbi:helix-turn-helix transcriptional regulator [Kitasatospora terrestris]|uniref:HTH cro/C1-type domain-containing protein n=1 Tax=Kitasatospora terrestris TaxID=258051 RepID=A0ABP9E6W2_9ACTN
MPDLTFNGPALRSARRRARIPATRLARAAGRTERSVRGYETGNVQPPIRIAARLAAEVGVDLVELLAPADERRAG